MEKHYLYPSALYVSNKPTEVLTILGSCVAVCIWDKELKIGGINHYMLPVWNGKGLQSPKFGNIAILKLIEKIENYGSNRQNLVAKVFGGAEVIAAQSIKMNIGERNIIIAKELLAEFKIPIIATSVGGYSGRKIMFYTQTGEVLHRFITNNNN